MKPKEKAEELIDKFENYSFMDIDKKISSFNSAKQCALIAVDEILELTKRNTYNPFDWNEITGVRYDKFWTEVKQEIEKL
jgi:malonyl CoA-acyl carrier protein transacylase